MQTRAANVFRTKCLFSIATVAFFCVNFQPCWSQGAPKVDTPVSFIQEALDTVNMLRERHQVGPLVMNLSLSADAEAWAKKIGGQCDKTGVAKAYYSRAAGVSENVWVSDKLPDVNGSVAVMAWYDQVKNFNWSDNMFSTSTAQFSTLVWKGTTQFGIAKYITPKNKFIMVVARFLPPGNVAYYSSFAANVFPPPEFTSTTTSTTTTPKPTTPKPIPTTPKPIPTTPKPIPTTPKPIPTTPKPIPTTPKPIPTTPKPIPTTPKPIPTTLKPIPTTPKPIPTTPKPIPTTPKPIPTTPKPPVGGAKSGVNGTGDWRLEYVVFIPEEENYSRNG